jgi:DNA-binding CsgD family transcriptional regulator
MAVLWALDLPWGLIVILPLLTYVGLRLIGPTREPTSVAVGRTPPPFDEQDAYRTCQRLRAEITLLGQQVSDEENRKWIGIVDDRFGQILAVIAEDAKYSMSVPLLDLVGTTNDLLSRYAKIVRRQLDDNEVHARVRDNLATINQACNRLWRQVNRDTVIDLEAMSETIEETLRELDTPPADAPQSIPPPVDSDAPHPEPTDSDPLDKELAPQENSPEWEDAPIPPLEEAGEPPALPSGPIPAPSPNGSCPETSLTPREREVLCLIVDGQSNLQIANNLFISEGTTKRHVSNIFAKLDVPSRSAAAAYANKRGVCRDTRSTG